jgi:hypothetical protein
MLDVLHVKDIVVGNKGYSSIFERLDSDLEITPDFWNLTSDASTSPPSSFHYW